MSAKKNILVVDDDIDFLEQIALMMKADGHIVTAAQGQAEAEEAMLTAIPDLAILDLMMENLDSGFVLCHHIKKIYPQTPVIILSAVEAETGLDFKARSAEAASWVKADTLMQKPVRPEQLRSEVKRLLKL